MEVYIDIVYLVNSIMGMFCILSLSLLRGKALSLIKIIGLGLFFGVHVITLYCSEWVYYVWVLLLCSLLERKHILRHFFIFLFIHESFLNSLSGVYRVGHVFILSTDFKWLPTLLLSFILLTLYTCFWFHYKMEIKNQAHYYNVIVKVNGTEHPGIGFMDTGNQAVFEGIPIIFSKKTIKSTLSPIPLEFIGSTKRMSGVLGSIYFQKQWLPCYIIMYEELELQVDYLLNFHFL